MGITGLLPFLEKASKRCHISEFRGCTVAIDTYCWLHKGVFGCAEKLIRGEDTNGYVQYCLKYIKMLQLYDIHPILVFDGQHLPAKNHTEEKRREQRKLSKKKAAELLRLGKIDEARVQMKCAIDITHKMALALIKECRENRIDCIVAPYEADAQLAYLNIKKFAHFVITEDSDLLLFGCNKIFYKMDIQGFGMLVEVEKINDCMKLRPDNYSFDKFRYMCILSGCDYLENLPGVGIKKALKFISLTADPSIYNVLLKLPSYLKLPNIVVTDDYREGFMMADATFKHQLVFDPVKRKLLPLHDPQIFGTKEEYCRNAGHLFDETLAFQMALGNVDPFTHERYDDWSPDLVALPTISIWSRQYNKPNLPVKKTPKLYAPTTKNMQITVKLIEEEKIVYNLNLEKELEIYKVVQRVPKKLKIEEVSEILSPTLSQEVNVPFKKLKKLSKFDRTVVNYEDGVTSRFFAPKKSASIEEPSISNYDTLLSGINNRTVSSESLKDQNYGKDKESHYKLKVVDTESIKESSSNKFGKFETFKKTNLRSVKVDVAEEVESANTNVVLEEVENGKNIGNAEVEDMPTYKTENKDQKTNLANLIEDLIQPSTSRKRSNIEFNTENHEEHNSQQQEIQESDFVCEDEQTSIPNAKSSALSRPKRPCNRKIVSLRKKLPGKNQMNLLTMFNKMKKN